MTKLIVRNHNGLDVIIRSKERVIRNFKEEINEVIRREEVLSSENNNSGSKLSAAAQVEQTLLCETQIPEGLEARIREVMRLEDFSIRAQAKNKLE